jgi:hypothetical protein
LYLAWSLFHNLNWTLCYSFLQHFHAHLDKIFVKLLKIEYQKKKLNFCRTVCRIFAE